MDPRVGLRRASRTVSYGTGRSQEEIWFLAAVMALGRARRLARLGRTRVTGSRGAPPPG